MCSNCGCSSSPEQGEKKNQYKCKSCGTVYEQEGECCGGSREKTCACGSGKYATECCEAEN